jgi:transcription factor IIIB subunit 2
MHGFIRALAGRLGHPGAIERATFIFDTVMERGELRWGRRAKLAAAASLALALRESELADPLRDLAVRLLLHVCRMT